MPLYLSTDDEPCVDLEHLPCLSNNIVGFTKGRMERHVVVLPNVLEGLKAAGLILKLRKCRFTMQRMECLGHELSRDGVRPVQRLVTAVQQFPSDAEGVKRFVHFRMLLSTVCGWLWLDDGTNHEVVEEERGMGMDDDARGII
ncbi:unnamed protein product [Phytophthora fragariaefolia]|uniref:Unnamed protein product n=1 Tax=Phytophthora fragariaefolia TaxID=1490495 RepID=A0A9W7DAJ6_9STRA|nr:unnamed protein product [Phytophthora fragariaefolia]